MIIHELLTRIKKETLMKKILCLALAGLVSCTTHQAAENDAIRDPAQFAPEKKYFIVQNVATEKTRVYEKCDFKVNPGCSHRLIFEEDNVVGGKDMRTDVGVQYIQKWVKFYQDAGNLYPSWYAPGYPPIPTGNFLSWFKDKAMPNGKGDMRGGFGWYAAIMTPAGKGQWMHGTVGWAKDGDRYINRAHGFWSRFNDIRSHGCTRHQNPAIAYLQHLVPAGATLIKVYAKEEIQDKTFSNYQNQRAEVPFNFIITKDGAKQTATKSSEASVVQGRIASGDISSSDILDQGTYMIDQFPDANYINGKRAKSGKSGDAYDLEIQSFTGTFYVDTGRFEGYRHPSQLNVTSLDGFGRDNPLPEYARK
jgi:L,D-transpeptidase catalytic domain